MNHESVPTIRCTVEHCIGRPGPNPVCRLRLPLYRSLISYALCCTGCPTATGAFIWLMIGLPPGQGGQQPSPSAEAERGGRREYLPGESGRVGHCAVLGHSGGTRNPREKGAQ